MSRRYTFSLMLSISFILFSIYLFFPKQIPSFLPQSVSENLIWPSIGGGITIGDAQRNEMRLGLDLQGGTRLLLKAIFPENFEGNAESVIEGTIQVLRKRVDGAGVSESEITLQDNDKISIH